MRINLPTNIKGIRIDVRQFTTTYLLLIILLILILMVILIKDPWHLLRADRKSNFVDKFSAEEVTKLELTESQITQTLKKDGDQWLVESRGNVPAKISPIETMLEAATKLKRQELVAKNQDMIGKFNCDEKGVHVRIFTAGDSPVADFYIGKNGPDYVGTYFRKEGENFVYLSTDNLRQKYSVGDLRDLKIMEVAEAQISKIQGEENGNAVTIEKQGESWKVVAPLEVALAKEAIQPLLTLLASFNGADVKMGLTDEEIGIKTPRKVITITTLDNQAKVLRVGAALPKTGEAQTQSYLKLEGDPRIFLITEETVKTLPSRIADLQKSL